MNEEEKKAIEYFKKYINDEEKKLGKNLTTKFNEHLKVLLDKVDNQQKEIKSLTDENNFLKEMYRGTTEYKAIKKKVEELGWN